MECYSDYFVSTTYPYISFCLFNAISLSFFKIQHPDNVPSQNLLYQLSSVNVQPYSQTTNIETIFSYHHICHLSSGSVYFISQIVFRTIQFSRFHLFSLVKKKKIYIYIYELFLDYRINLNILLNKVITSKHNANDVNPHFRSYTCL